MVRVQLPAAWEKTCTLRLLPHLHRSGSEGKKRAKKKTGRKKPSVGPGRGRGRKCEGAGVRVKFPCFFTGSAPKLKSFLSCSRFFLSFSESNLPAANKIKFKLSFFSLSVHISRDWQPAANPPGTQSQPSQTHLPANLTPPTYISSILAFGERDGSPGPRNIRQTAKKNSKQPPKKKGSLISPVFPENAPSVRQRTKKVTFDGRGGGLWAETAVVEIHQSSQTYIQPILHTAPQSQRVLFWELFGYGNEKTNQEGWR